eukprot:7906600-Pyramimonas_sp.AAC.1
MSPPPFAHRQEKACPMPIFRSARRRSQASGRPKSMPKRIGMGPASVWLLGHKSGFRPPQTPIRLPSERSWRGA